MLTLSAGPATFAAAFDLVRAAGIFGITLATLTAGGLTFGIAMLFRNREGAKPTSAAGIEQLSQEANTQLLAADDELAKAENELGYAEAQFGDDKTREFQRVVRAARASVAEAFRLRHQLDDIHPDSARERREWNNRIIALAGSARTQLGAQEQAFRQLRQSEADSPARLAALREGIADTRKRMTRAKATLASLEKRYAPNTFGEVKGNIDRAAELLERAQERANDAEQRIAAASVTAVSDDMNHAASLVHDARRLLDAVDEAEAALDEAGETLAKLVAEARASLEEAKAAHDAAPDADTGTKLIAATMEVEAALPRKSQGLLRTDPVADIDRVSRAVSSLDGALAGLRNQQQRLDSARAALAGALVGVHSQLAVTKSVMTGRRVGIAARSRLAEAERQLLLAESEADPVAALDAARRAATAARDAEDLARYDAR